MKFKSVIFAAVCGVAVCAFGISACKGKSEGKTDRKYTAEFYIDGNYVGKQSIDGADDSNYVIEPNFGNLEKTKDVFDGWYTSRQFTEKIDFSSKITESLSLYARNLTYYDALSVAVKTNGVNVTSSEVQVTGTDGKAIKMNGSTGSNRSVAYLDLPTGDNILSVYESNKKNTNYWYLFTWQLNTGNGSYYVCDTNMMIYFRATFNKYYEFNTSASDSDITDYKNNNWGYNTNTGLNELKNVITNTSREIDSIIAKYYKVA